MQLSQYIYEFRNLIRDPQGLFVSDFNATQYVNEARTATSLLTDCCRRLIVGNAPFGAQANVGYAVPGGAQPGADQNLTFATIVGQERYPYHGFANPYLKRQYAGIQGIRDVISVSGSWGGSVRPSLDWMPFEDFQAYCRSNQILVTNYPCVFSVYNDGAQGEVFLFPVPQTSNEMEWDIFCLVAPLNTNDDYDAIPAPFDATVKYYAAGRAFEASGRYGAAALMFAQFEDHNVLRRGAVDRGKVPQRYWKT